MKGAEALDVQIGEGDIARRVVMSGRQDGGRTCGEIEVDESELLLPSSVLPRIPAFPWQPVTEAEKSEGDRLL